MRIVGPVTGGEFNRDVARRLRRAEQLGGALARDKTYPSSQRPDAEGRAGVHIFDIDLGKPLWSNGTVWVDATGTAV